ncbi:unnamed protein product [Arabidopsis lyrata]|uniref:Predicted protein n=1 Tax=Arabidopsis lyrata subsp. lyrata TaxID=81972 RepID=D7LRJ7_ARALL|nr:uncharacterized protein LOC9313669 [Arabidopsis lyrata subsp. lyrata]EFH53860.1 predicted protein [Arabidopsis lyrata subsp. lyrata]CAH8267848.1 unnamed protein product [Arabidopsis lyrata]|eukprot:XP_002877601.1 uncharacterized protein LOC9313669 [Arabidopsis lyrata subsp. lyrata]
MFVSSSTCAYEIQKGNQASRSDPSLLQSDLHLENHQIKCVFIISFFSFCVSFSFDYLLYFYLLLFFFLPHISFFDRCFGLTDLDL